MSFPTFVRRLCLCLAVLAFASPASSQLPSPLSPAPAAPATPRPAADALGRSTPRGTVLGFLAAGRKADQRPARHYLNTRLSDEAAETLAGQLFVVLDARLPAQLLRVSDAPEGSRADPLVPDDDEEKAKEEKAEKEKKKRVVHPAWESDFYNDEIVRIVADYLTLGSKVVMSAPVHAAAVNQ